MSASRALAPASASPTGPVRRRDAARSRAAILAAAETLFSEHGYDGASLEDIAARAGLSRGTPSYFFGSKEQLYLAVLDQAFAARQAAVQAAFAPVREWCRGAADLDSLRRALAAAADAYLRFLTRRPSFVGLIMREELSGGRRLSARTTASTAMQEAFMALSAQPRSRGLCRFSVPEAVLLFTTLTFAPFSYRHTLMRAVGRDVTRRPGRQAQVKLAVEHLMMLLTGGRQR